MTTLACADVDGLLDAFVDGRLPPDTLLAVARHGGSCPACQRQIESFTAVGHMLGVTIRRDAAALDLSGVWAAVERRLEVAPPPPPVVSPTGWHRAFHGPALPAWGTAAAIAASAVLYLQPASRLIQPGTVATTAKPSGVVARVAWNKTDVGRIKVRKGRNVDVERLPKDGTTAVWVSYSLDGPR